MSDIFDEVDDILNEVSGDMDAAQSVDSSMMMDTEKNFNESELQDIMAEIESLEKEFDTDEVILSAPVIEAPFQKIDPPSASDNEFEPSGLDVEKIQTKAKPKVLAFDKKVTSYAKTTTSPLLSSEISFEALGHMSLNIAFKIGEEKAILKVDPEKGLMVTMAGVELCINEEEGCLVTMESGVKFTIPLTSSAASPKKKSA